MASVRIHSESVVALYSRRMLSGVEFELVGDLEPSDTAFEEPTKLLHFENRTVGPDQAVPTHHLRDQYTCKCQILAPPALGHVLICSRWFIDDGIEPFDIPQCGRDERTHVTPIQAPVAAAEWRDGY